jgi:signal transduction histidine kinase
MKLPLKERALSTVVIVPIAIVVIVVAALQYRWSTAVSEATGVRLADTLQLSMINWHLDFFRNFSEVCLTMRVDPDNDADGDVNQYARRFEEWRAVARYPDLVSGVYVLRSDQQANPQAFRLNISTRRFEPDQWPSRLVPLRPDLEQAASNIAPQIGQPAAQPFAESFYNFGDALKGWRFEPGIPALLHAIDGDLSGPDGKARDVADWFVIELSDAVLRNRILPDLAHRYFQGTDGLDYQVAVVAGNSPRNVIYSSDPDFGQGDVPDADGTMDLFGRIRSKAVGSPITVFHRPSENQGPTAAVGISWFPLLRRVPEDQDWQLVVRHRRGGSLGAFVAEMHQRNLAISFGALLLLVVSMAMLIVTSNRAQRLAKLQMDFVTAVSHELRTPLTVISSAADNITHGVVEGKEQLRQYGSVIGNQARQLSGLVEQILLFATTRQAPERYSLRLLNVSAVIDATLTSTEGLIKAAQFTVEREIQPNLPPVTGDLVALSQCLQNLITNALKYGRDGRWIGIRAVVAPDAAGRKEVQVSISDRGIGVDPADASRIFEPFYRSPAAKAAQIHGTGLGLSLAKSIAEAMEGQLTVTSTPGRGSTFTLHLPCPEQVSASVGSANQPLSGSPVLDRG